MSPGYVPTMRSPWLAVVVLFFVVVSLWTLRPSSILTESSPRGTEKPDIAPSYNGGKEADPNEVKAALDTIPNETYQRPLITYVYAESETAKENLRFFLSHGLHAYADFVFIFNTPSDLIEEVPKVPNIKIVKRENSCFDLGSHAEVLKEDNLYKKYKKFILMNASIRGPFLPWWSGSCWTDLYLGKITEKNKLVGMTSNCWPQFHIQSMLWATDLTGLELLLQPKGIGKCFSGWKEAVNAETRSTSLILQAGYTAMPMMAWFHADEENFVEKCDTSQNGDLLWDKKYHGTNLHPYETIFQKTNRDVDPVTTQRLTDWHDKRNYSSYDVCRGG